MHRSSVQFKLSSVAAALNLLQLEILIGDKVQRALLKLEPDDALRTNGTRL